MSEPFRSYREGELLVIRWIDPSREGSKALTELIERTNREHGKVVFAAIIGGECPIPDNDTRKALAENYDVIESLVSHSWIVLLGQTLRQSVFRSILAGLGLVLGRRLEIEIVVRVDTLLDELAKVTGRPREGLRKVLLGAEVLVAEDG